ncbi:MAG: glycosyl hydrolase [Verrucomicrobiota bacterium]
MISQSSRAWPRLLGAATLLLAASPLQAQFSEESFRNPPIEARPSALWTWLNGHVDFKQITRELEEMKAKGMRGAIIWDLGSISDPEKIFPEGQAFFGSESIKTIHHAMDEAERLGLELGFVASSSWNAGGTWITPENASKALIWSEQTVKGPSEFSAILPLPEKASEHFQNIAVMAVSDDSNKTIASSEATIRLDEKLSPDGKLTWSVPAGKWRILRFICNNTGEFLNCPSPNSKGLVIDHLSQQATDAHINHMLDTLSRGSKGFGPLKVLMLDSYEVRPAHDWTPEFTKLFTAQNNYDPTPWLPTLAGWTVQNEELSKRFLHDYHKFVSDLMVKTHYARVRELANQRGLQFLAEAGHGGHPRVDPLKALGASDIPMGEFWNHRKNWVTKEAASAAHIYGKRLVNSESLTGWQNWQDGPANYKRSTDIAFCAGLNQITFHTFAHNPPEAGLPGFAYHAGEHFNVNSTWWDQSGPMLVDMSRSSHLLQQGSFIADVCAYYGDEAPNLVPARRISPTIKSQWSDEKCAHCGRDKPVDLDTLGQGYDYDYINEEVILTRMQVKDGRLVLPDGMSYRVMILPDRKTISLEALKKIGELAEAGATIIGSKPERSNSLRGFPDCDKEVQALAAKIWGNCDGENVRSHNYGKGKVIWNIPIAEVLSSMKVERDFVAENIDNSNQHIDYIHRSTGDEEIYFVSNSALTREVVQCRFRVGEGHVPSFWNPEDGSVKPCHAFEIKDGLTHITLDLAAASSIFVIFKKGKTPEHIVEIQSPHPTGMEILGMDKDQISTKIWNTGDYTFETSSGRTGKISISEIPADQPIRGPWKISFPKDRGAPESISMDALTDWTKHSDIGVKYFSGAADYQNTFTLTDVSKNPIILDLGSVKEVAVVRVNGKKAGVLWKEPYQIDITALTKAGENQIEIQVINTWNNRLVGDSLVRREERMTRTNLSNKFNPKSPLLSSGLLGPVVLKFPVTATCELTP